MGGRLIRRALYFASPGRAEVREELFDAPGVGEVLVETELSAISAGTELLVYRGLVSQDTPTDTILSSLSGHFRFPLKYGYSSVGRVTELGPQVNPAWLGSRVFAFQPHQSHYSVPVSQLFAVPDTVACDRAVLLPNVETALSLVMDGRPLIGEKVAVVGQGIVGRLTTDLLALFPLERLIALDIEPARLNRARAAGAECVDGRDGDALAALGGPLAPGEGIDLVFELTGNPAAIEMAVSICGYGGRIVIGSWYGAKRAEISLGTRFHRGRMSIISSQVSSIPPELTGRFCKERRLKAAWRYLEAVRPERYITGRYPLEAAPSAYEALDRNPAENFQAVITYP